MTLRDKYSQLPGSDCLPKGCGTSVCVTTPELGACCHAGDTRGARCFALTQREDRWWKGDKSSAQAQGWPCAGICKAADRRQNIVCCGSLNAEQPPPTELPVKLVACNPELINSAERSGGKGFPSFAAPLIHSLLDAFVLIMPVGETCP